MLSATLPLPVGMTSSTGAVLLTVVFREEKNEEELRRVLFDGAAAGEFGSVRCGT